MAKKKLSDDDLYPSRKFENVEKARAAKVANRKSSNVICAEKIPQKPLAKGAAKPPRAPKAPKSKAELAAEAERIRTKQRKYQKEAFDAVADIGELPEIVNPKRRARCENDLLAFLSEYFPFSTGLSPLGPDQIAAVKRIEVVIAEEGWAANIMPRGFIKSTMAENSVLWAILYGKRKYPLFFAGTATLAEKGILSMKRELIGNEALLEDFPEACYPLIKLEGKAMRAATQTYRGELTNVIYSKDVLRLAHIPGAQCSGAIIESYGLLAPPRGTRYKDEQGRNVRPDIAILDDPQTDDSAKSATQTDSRMGYIKNSISMMGGHGNEMGMVVNATVIKAGDLADQISDPELSPEWQSVRIAMVKKMPLALDSHWLGEYARLRRKYDRSDPRGRVKAKEASTAYYKKHLKIMNEGHEVAWDNIGLEKTEISALQHAMNILIDKGPDAFASECQNRPLKNQSVTGAEITRETALRYSGYDRYIVPASATNLVVHIDVHDTILYYCVAAVENDFTGYVVDYGVYPEQNTQIFSMRSAKQTLIKHYKLDKKEDTERAIELGVEDLLDKLFKMNWRTPNGELVPIKCALVDVGYKSTEVANAIRRSKSLITLQSLGIGIGPSKKPMIDYDLSPKAVIKYGPDQNNVRWILPTTGRDGHLYRVHFDSNYWKDTMLARLTQTSRIARWQLFDNFDHSFFINHCMAETPAQVTKDGRTVNVWSGSSHGIENHWWDTLVGCGLGASLCGCYLPVSTPVTPVIETPTKNIAAVVVDENLFLDDNGRSFFASAREY